MAIGIGFDRGEVLLLVRCVLLACVGPGFVEFEAKVELCKFGRFLVGMRKRIVTHTFILA